ncbi:MAG: hypothetical protein Q4P84_05745, partial [Elusimicrobiales bacterium]|nr:hypothetical protein [Elusimicrobiales bacterium]
DSAPVRWAMAFTQWRKRFKTAVKRLFYPHREPKTDVLRVLVHIKGGIGDVAMTRVFIKKLRETLPQAEISFCFDSKAVADMIFSDGLISRFQDRRYRPEDYDLVISGCHLLTYALKNWPRLSFRPWNADLRCKTVLRILRSIRRIWTARWRKSPSPTAAHAYKI